MYILAYYNASVVNVVNAAKGLAQALSHHHWKTETVFWAYVNLLVIVAISNSEELTPSILWFLLPELDQLF
jgi:hypothetical protein